MSNGRRRRRRMHHSEPLVSVTAADGGLDDLMGFLSGRSIRRTCSHCGSPRVEWTDRAGAIAAGKDLSEAESFLGAPVEQAWQCLACDEWGFFGPVGGSWDDEDH